MSFYNGIAGIRQSLMAGEVDVSKDPPRVVLEFSDPRQRDLAWIQILREYEQLHPILTGPPEVRYLARLFGMHVELAVKKNRNG